MTDSEFLGLVTQFLPYGSGVDAHLVFSDYLTELNEPMRAAMVQRRAKYVSGGSTYMMIGDVDKHYHRPECECTACENWRKASFRPTHEELRDIERNQKSPQQKVEE